MKVKSLRGNLSVWHIYATCDHVAIWRVGITRLCHALCMLVGRQAAWRVTWHDVVLSSCLAGALLTFGRQAAWRPGAIIVGPYRQAAWWHEAVAVELLGGDCKGLGPCFAWRLEQALSGRQAAWRPSCVWERQILQWLERRLCGECFWRTVKLLGGPHSSQGSRLIRDEVFFEGASMDQ